MKNKFIYLAILAAGFASCEPEFENEVNANYTSGDADFTSYVAIGNSLTAGYMDGTVSRVGQTYSFPNLLAQKFALVGGGEFTQPSYEDDVNNLGGLMLRGVPIADRRRVIDANQVNPDGSRGAVEIITGTSTIEVSNLQATAYNNMGVPGAKSFHLGFSGYGNVANLPNANPYFVRHATSPSATILGDAMSKNPTFFTNWIGANDVLSYATNGGAKSDGVTPADDHNTTGNMNPATYGGNDITNANVFASVYSTIINTLTMNGAKGVVATVPSVTSIPYFTTVPFNPVPLDNATATRLNGIDGYASYNGGLDLAFSNGLITNQERMKRKINFVAGKNPVVIVDNDLTNLSGLGIPSYRMTTSQDLIVLPARSFIGTLVGGNESLINGVSVPLSNKWVLTANEKAKVANATASYNAAIVSIANANGLAVADMNAIMNQLVTGLRIEDGTIYTANYFSSATASSVLFSLDGVHPNAKGYAVITNEIIKVINRHYNANLPLVYASSFPGATILPTN